MFYIGNFTYATNQEETLEEDRRHGEFSLIVDADNPYLAILKFKDRIVIEKRVIFFKAIVLFI